MREKQFLFLDGAKSSKAGLALARSHAMKGKNTGRKLSEPRKSRTAGSSTRPEKTHPYGARAAAREIIARESGDGYPIEQGRYLGNILVTFQFPIELGPSSLNIISKCKQIRNTYRALIVRERFFF